MIGRFNISISEFVQLLILKFKKQPLSSYETINTIIFSVRLPRIIAALLIGSSLSVSGSRNIWEYQEPDEEQNFRTEAREEFIYKTFRGALEFNKKINTKNKISTGLRLSNLQYDLFSDYYDDDFERLIEDAQSAISGALESYDYQNQRREIEQKATEEQQKSFEEIEKHENFLTK